MRQSGISLVEILAVLVMLTTVAAIAMPAFSSVGRSARLTSAVNEMVASLNLARSEAIKRNQRVVVCKSANATTCTTTGGWEQGWIVFQDMDNDAVHDDNETIVAVRQPMPPQLRLTGNSHVSRYISYAPTGATKLVSGAFQAGTLIVCNRSATRADARQIIISSTGRVRVSRTKLASCL